MFFWANFCGKIKPVPKTKCRVNSVINIGYEKLVQQCDFIL
jgi:hypothetical protein